MSEQNGTLTEMQAEAWRLQGSIEKAAAEVDEHNTKIRAKGFDHPESGPLMQRVYMLSVELNESRTKLDGLRRQIVQLEAAEAE